MLVGVIQLVSKVWPRNFFFEECVLLALHIVRLERLDAGNAALDQFAIMDDMVCLSGQHALDIVVDVAENYTVSFGAASWWGCQRLDLKALKNWDGVLRRRCG